MSKHKKREMVCPHTDCIFYSCEQSRVDGEWMTISFCSHPNNDLIDSGKSCNYYRINWAQQIQKVHRANPADKIKLERQALLKLLQAAVGNLSPDERDAVLGLVEHLKEQEERVEKLMDIHNEIDQLTKEDIFMIDEPEQIQIKTPDSEPVDETRNGFVYTPFKPVNEEILKEDTPEEIVREFIESWNKQEFEKEYDFLGDRLRLTPKKDYVLSRKYAYADTLKQGKTDQLPVQELGEIHSVKVNGTQAKIICQKVEKFGRFPKSYRQKYSLQKENGSWKITDVQTREK